MNKSAFLLFLFLFCFGLLCAQDPSSSDSSWTSLSSRSAVQTLLDLSETSPPESFDFEQFQDALCRAHPNDVTLEDLKERALGLQSIIEKRHQREGLLFPLNCEIHPTHLEYTLSRGGDIALYSGTYLAGLVFRYLCEPESKNLLAIAEMVEGLHKITHIGGKKGFPVRFALPLEEAISAGMVVAADYEQAPWYHIYYKNSERPEYGYLQNLVVGQNTDACMKSLVGQKLTPFQRYYQDQFYYTRTTRDQLTGIVLGLALTIHSFEPHFLQKHKISLSEEDQAWVEAILQSSCEIALDLFFYLHSHEWHIHDPLAKKPGTSADGVTGILKLSVQMLARRALMNTLPQEYRKKTLDRDSLSLEDRAYFHWWDKHYFALRSYQTEMLPPGLTDLEGMVGLGTSAQWYPLTFNYYAWNLRTDRIFTILLLDDIHPDFAQVCPISWPNSTLEKEQVNRRNRQWFFFWENFIWKNVACHSNIWFTYTYNYAKRLLWERHTELVLKPEILYGLQRHEFTAWFPDCSEGSDLQELRDQVLFPPSKLYYGKQQTLSAGLDRAHFHLRSMALAPLRSFGRPAQYLEGKALKAVYTVRNQEKIVAPHLRPYSRFWMEGKDPQDLEREKKRKLDQNGLQEGILIDVPTLYWLGRWSGVLEYRYDGFLPFEFVPPATYLKK
jgi:hypothetical protein